MFQQKDQKGFSLISVMIAMGLLGVLIASTSEIFTMFGKFAKTSTANTEVNILYTRILSHLSDPNNCSATFYNHYIPGSLEIDTATAGLPFDSSAGTQVYLKKVDNDGSIRAYDVSPAGNEVKLIGMDTLDPTSMSADLFAKYGLSDVPKTDGWDVLVRFTFQKGTSNNLLGSKNIIKYTTVRLNNFTFFQPFSASTTDTTEDALRLECSDPNDANKKYNKAGEITYTTEFDTGLGQDVEVMSFNCFAGRLAYPVAKCGL